MSASVYGGVSFGVPGPYQGTALALNGTGYLTLPTAPTSPAFTLECWVLFNGLPINGYNPRLWANEHNVGLELYANNNLGSLNYTVYTPNGGESNGYTYNLLGLAYVGALSNPTVTVASGTLTVTAGGSTLATLPFASYPTLGDVATALQGVSGLQVFTTAYLSYASTLLFNTTQAIPIVPGQGTTWLQGQGLLLNTWYHVALVFSQAVSMLCINGLPLNINNGPHGPLVAAPYPLSLGYNPQYQGDWFTGSLAGVAWYDRGLTAKQLQAHVAAATSPGHYQQAVWSDCPHLYYPLDDAVGTTAPRNLALYHAVPRR